MESKLYQQNHAEINGFNVWHWLIDTPIGQYNVVQYEAKGKEIIETVIPHDYEKAERLFNRYCNKVLKGAN